jgi:RNA polymerase sigma-32 factor
MTTRAIALPALSTDTGLSKYLADVNNMPFLTEEEEYLLAMSWVKDENVEAAHKLVTSHLRLVAKIAMGFRGYGLPIMDIISEGNVGLMQAVKKFKPEKGFRLSTYAMWWIKASIHEYILKSWSLVKMGTTAAQKKLFFNLRRLRNKIGSNHEGDLYPDEVKMIAGELDVSEYEVVDMDRRLNGGEVSLNKSISADGDSDWVDLLEDETQNQEEYLAIEQDKNYQKNLLANAMETLNERERDIVSARKLSDEPSTLDDLSKIYKISKERVRQIEARALEKLQSFVLEAQKS